MEHVLSCREPGAIPLAVSRHEETPPDAICPACGAPARRQPTIRAWTREAGWQEHVDVRCLSPIKHELPTPRTGANQYGYGKTYKRVGCGYVTLPDSIRQVEGPDITTKEEQPMPRGADIPQDKKEELFRRVRAGEHPTDVGRDLGIHQGTAAEMVRRAGIKYQHKDMTEAARAAKARKAAQKPPSPFPEPRQRSEQSCVKLPPEAVAEGIRLCLEENHSVPAAAEKVGVNFRSLKGYVTEARKARGLSLPTHPAPMDLPPAPASAVTDPEQPPVAIRLLTSPDVQAFLRQPSAIQDAIRTYLDQPEAVQLVVRTLISNLKASA